MQPPSHNKSVFIIYVNYCASMSFETQTDIPTRLSVDVFKLCCGVASRQQVLLLVTLVHCTVVEEQKLPTIDFLRSVVGVEAEEGFVHFYIDPEIELEMKCVATTPRIRHLAQQQHWITITCLT